MVIVLMCVHSYWFSLYATFTCSMCFLSIFVHFYSWSMKFSTAHRHVCRFCTAYYVCPEQSEKNHFQMSFWVNRWICNRTILSDITPSSSAAASRFSSMWHKLNITYSHCAFCNAVCGANVQNRNLQSSYTICLFCLLIYFRGFSSLCCHLFFVGVSDCTFIFMSHSLCVLFGVHFQFFEVRLSHLTK